MALFDPDIIYLEIPMLENLVAHPNADPHQIKRAQALLNELLSRDTGPQNPTEAQLGDWREAPNVSDEMMEELFQFGIFDDKQELAVVREKLRNLAGYYSTLTDTAVGTVTSGETILERKK